MPDSEEGAAVQAAPSRPETKRRFKTAPQRTNSVVKVVAAMLLLAAQGGALLLFSSPHLFASRGLQPVPVTLGDEGDFGAAMPPGKDAGGEDDFALDAAIEARIPRYWAELELICPDRAFRPYKDFPAHERSSAAHAQVEPLPGFRGLGRWHVLRLTTYTASGQRKTRGGDVWWALLYDNATQARFPARVFDEGDGSYSIAFVALVPGTFFLRLRLYYTLCAGFQDPFAKFEEGLRDRKEDAHCYEGEAVNITHPAVVIPGDGGYQRIPDAAGGNGHDPELGSAARAVGDFGKLAARLVADAEAGSKRSADDALPGSDAASAPAPAAAAPINSTKAGELLLLLLRGGVLRGDQFVYRAGPLASPSPAGGVQLQPAAGPQPPWHLAASPGVQRLIMWGDSTVKRTFQNLEALARFPCKDGFPPHMHLEVYRSGSCKPVPSGEADPPLERALLGCTGGATWGTVPMGVTVDARFFESAFLANLGNWSYNDTFAKAAGAFPPPKEFSVVYLDGWGVKAAVEYIREAGNLRSTDAVVVNVGAHAVRSLTYQQWKAFINDIAPALASSNASIVWRTTMPVCEHVYRDKNGTTFFPEGHFQNDARRILFDSYAEFRLRAEGVRVWDIAAYGLAGAYRPRDMFHMDGATMQAINLDMARHVMC